MKQTLVVPLLLASLLLPGSAMAKPLSPSLGQVLRALGGPTFPAEWAGEWDTMDSVYFCQGPLLATSAGRDTICGGGQIEPELVCTGTATANGFDGTCTGTYVEDGCTIDSQLEFHMTVTGDSYRTVLISTATFSGTPKCDDIPPMCLRIVTEGSRLGPVPPGACTTPVKRSTWGQLKTIYR